MQDSPKNFYKKLLGRHGEKLAEKYLVKNGYSVLERNYTTHYGEADLIVAKDGVIVFVEVKTRSNDKFGRPCEAVDFTKQAKYRRIAEYFFYQRAIDTVDVRFDVVEVIGKEINHMENAFI